MEKKFKVDYHLRREYSFWYIKRLKDDMRNARRRQDKLEVMSQLHE